MSLGRRAGKDFMAFSAGQKIVTVATLLAIVVGGYLFSKWTSQVTYAPLYTNLAASDASAIVDKLNSAKEPYQLSQGGTEILVPQKDVYNLRLTMSSAGLPSSGQSGFSLLDHEGVTTSEFVEHVDYQQALEGELDNTIAAIKGVQTAQVNLAIPTDSVFADDTQKTTAAVLLTLDQGTSLTSDQIRSVVNLVSSSVPGLSANDVSVSDSTGKVLAAAGTGITDSSGGLTSQTEAAQAYDNQVSSNVQQMLDRVLGVGHSSVTVNAQLNFDSASSSSHLYTYASGVPPLAESSQGEVYGSAAPAGAGGVVGAGSPVGSVINTTGFTTAASTGAGGGTSTSTSGNYSNISVTQNNAVGTIDTNTVVAPGGVKQLGVSVVVDKSAANSIDPTELRSLVSSAVGLNTQRGDSLAIATLPFDTTSAKQAAAAAAAAKKADASAASSAQLTSLIKTGGALVLVLVVIIFTALASKRRRAADDVSPADELDQFLATLRETTPVDGVPVEPAMRTATAPTAVNTELHRRAVTELADDQPDDMARLLRNWMNTKGA